MNSIFQPPDKETKVLPVPVFSPPISPEPKTRYLLQEAEPQERFNLSRATAISVPSLGHHIVRPSLLVDDIISMTSPFLKQQKSQCKQALQELLQTTGEANWDGEGADPVTEEIVGIATRVVDQLPLDTIEPPEISADPHGNVEFDWYLDNGTMFTISIGIEGDIALSGLHAKRGDKLSAIEKDGDDPLPRILSYGVDWLRKMKDK